MPHVRRYGASVGHEKGEAVIDTAAIRAAGMAILAYSMLLAPSALVAVVAAVVGLFALAAAEFL